MGRREEINEALTSYAKRLREVRKLSAPSVEEVKNADDYCRLLLHNFRRIGELAGENAKVLDDILMPMLQGSEPIDEESAEELDALNRLLMDEYHYDMVDTCLAEMINDRLTSGGEEMPEDDKSSDLDKRVRTLDRNIDMSYEHISRSYHSNDTEELTKAFKKGSTDYREMLEFLDKDRFSLLSAESQSTVIVAARFGACLYELTDPASMILYLKEFRELIKDPFYHNCLPDLDWDAQDFLACEYIAETCYRDDLPEEVYKASFEAGCECEKMMACGAAGAAGEQIGEEHIRTVVMTAAAVIMDPSFDDRLSEVIDLYEKRDKSDYSRGGTYANLSTASLIFRMINIMREKKGGAVSEKLLTLQRSIPYEMMRYYSLSRSAEMVALFAFHLNNFLEDFREVPGGINCSELCMRALVSIHPPTYVHSNMVARLSLCIARHLITTHTELFIGFPGCESEVDVNASRDRILEYVYNSALYHDIGKLLIIDTIAMYGRRLLDAEFMMLKKHPDNGAELAERFDSLKQYADVIRAHHLWYDGSGGYPADFNASSSPYKAVIDIVMVADCMDAATDRVGRSYSRGKTLDELINEINEGSGKRYSPYVAEILNDPGTYEDIKYLLDEGRNQIYRDTFGLLTDLLRKGQNG